MTKNLCSRYINLHLDAFKFSPFVKEKITDDGDDVVNSRGSSQSHPKHMLRRVF